jgi:hypothetical protein
MCVLCFNKINTTPPFLTLSLSLCCPITQQLTVHWFMLSSYMMQCFNIYHSLIFSFPLPRL